MLNINMNMKDFGYKQLEILSVNIKRSEKCKYIHEYICIDIKTFIRYKIEFETNRLDLTFNDVILSAYDVIRHRGVELNSVMLEANERNGEIFKITKLD